MQVQQADIDKLYCGLAGGVLEVGARPHKDVVHKSIHRRSLGSGSRRSAVLYCCWQRPPRSAHTSSLARTHARARRSDRTAQKRGTRTSCLLAPRPAVPPTLRYYPSSKPAFSPVYSTCGFPTPDSFFSTYLCTHSTFLDVLNRGQLKLFPDFALLTRVLVSR